MELSLGHLGAAWAGAHGRIASLLPSLHCSPLSASKSLQIPRPFSALPTLQPRSQTSSGMSCTVLALCFPQADHALLVVVQQLLPQPFVFLG